MHSVNESKQFIQYVRHSVKGGFIYISPICLLLHFGYFYLIAGTKYPISKVKEGKICLAHSL